MEAKARIELGLQALRDKKFKVNRKKWIPEVWDKVFDDLLDNSEFFGLALVEGLFIPYDDIQKEGPGLGKSVLNNKQLYLLGLPIYFASNEMRNDPDVRRQHEKRMEQGLVALRTDRTLGEHDIFRHNFRFSHWNWAAHANAGNFDDLMNDAEFLKKARQEGLDVPFDQFLDYEHKFLAHIADDDELFELGLPLNGASARIKSNKALVLKRVSIKPHEVEYASEELRGDFDVALAALQAVAEQDKSKPEDQQMGLYIFSKLREPIVSNPYFKFKAAALGIQRYGDRHTKSDPAVWAKQEIWAMVVELIDKAEEPVRALFMPQNIKGQEPHND